MALSGAPAARRPESQLPLVGSRREMNTPLPGPRLNDSHIAPSAARVTKGCVSAGVVLETFWIAVQTPPVKVALWTPSDWVQNSQMVPSGGHTRKPSPRAVPGLPPKLAGLSRAPVAGSMRRMFRFTVPSVPDVTAYASQILPSVAVAARS